MGRIRAHLTYANVMATLAMFIALGGTGYAALRIGSGQIRDNSIRSRDVRNDSLRGKDIRNSTVTGNEVLESSLGTVPSAQRAGDATTVGGVSADALKVSCPAGTALAAGGCFELASREPKLYRNAVVDCAFDRRRLPTHAELLGLLTNAPSGSELGTGGELTASVFESPQGSGTLRVLVMTDEFGSVSSVGTDLGNERRFRCVAPPLN